MCNHCGCSSNTVHLKEPGTDLHRHLHTRDASSIKLEQSLVAGNEALAGENRHWLSHRNITCINLMGTPGAGKTRLLEASIPSLKQQGRSFAVLEGDQDTLNDAERIKNQGARAIQINTGTGCHLDAAMVKAGLEALAPDNESLIFIENVGNLVCPALFDLGETYRVAMMAVTDGDDKPQKYPHLFASADLVLINKIDLLPYLEFDLDKVKTQIARLNPNAEVLLVCATSGQGLDNWLGWIERHGNK